MHFRSGWNWELGEKSIADINQWKDKFNWVEEPYVSPDGEASQVSQVVVHTFDPSSSATHRTSPLASGSDRSQQSASTQDVKNQDFTEFTAASATPLHRRRAKRR